jgi:simple sugar transport system ATP-binding protein
MTWGDHSWDGRLQPEVDRSVTEELGVGTIHQDSALVPTMSISRNIFMSREITDRLGFMRTKEMDAIATEILDTVDTIEGTKSSRQLVASLSGGQAQAVAIARAVHFKRSLLILDEPTSAVAVRATEALLNCLRHLKTEGVSSILVTHTCTTPTRSATGTS